MKPFARVVLGLVLVGNSAVVVGASSVNTAYRTTATTTLTPTPTSSVSPTLTSSAVAASSHSPELTTRSMTGAAGARLTVPPPVGSSASHVRGLRPLLRRRQQRLPLVGSGPRDRLAVRARNRRVTSRRVRQPRRAAHPGQGRLEGLIPTDATAPARRRFALRRAHPTRNNDGTVSTANC